MEVLFNYYGIGTQNSIIMAGSWTRKKDHLNARLYEYHCSATMLQMSIIQNSENLNFLKITVPTYGPYGVEIWFQMTQAKPAEISKGRRATD